MTTDRPTAPVPAPVPVGIPPYGERDLEAALIAIDQWSERPALDHVSTREALAREVSGAIAVARAEGYAEGVATANAARRHREGQA